MDEVLKLPSNSLLIFIDETGNEDLSDPNNPTFGRGGCGALLTEYKHRISKPWKRLKRERLGGATKHFHAADFEQTRPTMRQIHGINNFMAQPFWRFATMCGQRGIFPKEHAKGVSAIGHGFPLPKPLIFSFGGLGGRLAEQVARDVDQREPPPFFGQFGGVGLDEYLNGLVAGINFDTQRAALEIDFVTPSRFTANNCMGHLRSYERLKG